MSTVHIEWTQGIARTFDDGFSFDNADEYVSVVKLDKIGPDTVLLSADLSRRRLTRADIAELRLKLLAAGFSLVHCWRKAGKKVPYQGRVIRNKGKLVLWEIEL